VLWAFAGLYVYEWAVNVTPAVAAVAGHDVRLDSSGRFTDTSHLSGWLVRQPGTVVRQPVKTLQPGWGHRQIGLC
jgi:hypothetical protein